MGASNFGRIQWVAGLAASDRIGRRSVAAITLGPGPVSFADLLKTDPLRRVRVVNLIDAGNDDMAPPIQCSSAFQPFSATLEGAPI
ncbi:hypothetical protein [Agrobacterium vitis]|uniref:Uncharacterized protein n=1 Tax=Agrobacterium vitis TaxID=373 RepID=A0AAE2REW9_AGRVI|nr:hypothetical protein [Agrobacterium vitis]MBF2716259.1 hypothetical protein [Agrobacterium vitis]MVA22556.1 hypothetical protein [Agrobacterium vitis]